jgi:hypothetical protein
MKRLSEITESRNQEPAKPAQRIKSLTPPITPKKHKANSIEKNKTKKKTGTTKHVAKRK